MKNIVNRGAVLLSFALVLTSGCEWRTVATTAQADEAHPGMHENAGTGSDTVRAQANEPSVAPKSIDIINSKGTKIGTAKLSQVAEGVKFQVEVSGLTPGKHGIHVHQTGVCTPPDFTSAGEHFNPEGKKHGFDNPQGYHAGDLPNLEVGSDGTARAEFVDTKVTLAKDKANSLVKTGGTALVIHENADDYKTDPSGNSGSRIACGVIM
ncbi:Superoxide dismutase-like protein YojM precursor [Paenibacillus konkukensis]|uniref:Superoxide dismutase [Cu-Zn] n=1 Tax=Paenibacillus konkukensis TaxID=2020716 RepID=A0ABY4RJ81_9BACL|nr:superoxide dismutase family protein [Paenibacillus konkukensis]UQZ81569.1 Superoxide dismutase-like protein YojM precursor [Paenibacillus konkukensis]